MSKSFKRYGKNFETLRDAQEKRHQEDWRMERRHAKRATQEAVFEAPQDPRIGMLCRNGRPVYYAYDAAGTYIEGSTAAAVTVRL